jgi:hypothetical protein
MIPESPTPLGGRALVAFSGKPGGMPSWLAK